MLYFRTNVNLENKCEQPNLWKNKWECYLAQENGRECLLHKKYNGDCRRAHCQSYTEAGGRSMFSWNQQTNATCYPECLALPPFIVGVTPYYEILLQQQQCEMGNKGGKSAKQGELGLKCTEQCNGLEWHCGSVDNAGVKCYYYNPNTQTYSPKPKNLDYDNRPCIPWVKHKLVYLWWYSQVQILILEEVILVFVFRSQN